MSPEYLIQESTLTDIADAIRSKTGKSDTLTPEEMATEIGGIAAGGGESGEAAEHSEAEDWIISRQISGVYINDRVTRIGDYAFFRCSALTSVNFPAVTSTGMNTFFSCSALATVNFPVLTHIGNSTFISCSALTSVNFPAVTSIGMSAFHSCRALTSVNFPAATSIGGKAFGFCTSLTRANFPVARYIGDYAFSSTALTSVNFPVATSINYAAFYYCSALTTAEFGSGIPGISTIVGARIGASAFISCVKLTTLELYHPFVVTLSNINAFASTPMSVSTLTGSFGSIYVPASLVAAYQSATNWVTYSARITALSDT